MTEAGKHVCVSPPSSSCAAAVFPLLQSHSMICKHKICSSGKKKNKIIPNKRTKISTWELAGTFKDFFFPFHLPQRKKKKQILLFKNNKIALYKGQLTPSPKHILTDSHKVNNQTRSYSALGINQQANRKKNFRLQGS